MRKTLGLLACALAACGGDPSAPTYHADAKPILDSRCATCHQPGDIGPFPLTTHAEVLAFEGAVRASIVNGTMPPWQPSDDCTDYIGNMDLTGPERDTLLAWLDAGAPEGDPADAPEPAAPEAPAFVADMTLRVPEPYTPTKEPDDYRCQLIDWPASTTRYVTGLRVVPDQRAIVHHVIVFVASPDQVERYRAFDEAEPGPGYTCYGGPTAGGDGALAGLEAAEIIAAAQKLGIRLTDLASGNLTPQQTAALLQELGVSVGGFANIGSWVPGAAELPAPAGSGIRVEPGSLLVAQIHYNTLSSDPVADQSTIELATTDTVEREATQLAALDLGWVSDGRLGGDAMTLPAGAASVQHATSIAYDSLFALQARRTLGMDKGEALLIHRANHHMHELGVSQRSEVAHADGTRSCLLDIPDWDFNWQGAYGLAEPVRLGPGDTLEMACTWDNSAANQPVVDGEVRAPADVAWGEGTSDEMCLGGFYVTAADR